MQSRLPARDYEVPKKPMFLLDGMNVVQNMDTVAFVSNSVVDSVMYGTNGYLGLRHKSEVETVGIATEVILNGVYSLTPTAAPLQNPFLPPQVETGATLCTVDVDCRINEDSGTLWRIPFRTLSLTDGGYRSFCEDVISSDGGLAFDSSYIRAVSVEDLHLWGAEVTFSHFRLGSDASSACAGGDTERNPSVRCSSRSGEMSGYRLPRVESGLGPAVPEEHAYTLELSIAIAVDLTDWEVLQVEPMETMGQRSRTSGQVLHTQMSVSCLVETDTGTVAMKPEVELTPCTEPSDGAPLSYTRNSHAAEGETPHIGEGLPRPGAQLLTLSCGSFTREEHPRPTFVSKVRYVYPLTVRSLPRRVVLTFRARHADGAPSLPTSFPTIAEMIEGRRRSLEAFWAGYHIDLQLQEELIADRMRLGLLFSAFRLFSVSYNLNKGLPRAGCSSAGSGLQLDLTKYIFHGIYYTLTMPPSALSLLRCLYDLLPQARANALHLSLSAGALYPTTTISGRESRLSVPVGDVRCHVNAEIGYLINLFFNAVESIFVEDRLMLLEMMLETARVWPEMGVWLHGGTVFCLDNLAGADEYSGGATGNFYLHLSAKKHLLSAVELFEMHERLLEPSRMDRLLAGISMSRGELAGFRHAAEAIRIRRSDRNGVYMVHDHFDTLAEWKGERTKHPIRCQTHPLAVYRKKIVDVPDVLLGMLLYPQDFERREFERNVAYYQPLCTFDSPEGLAVMAVAQCSSYLNLAQPIPLLRSLSNLDLDNIAYSAEEGLHFSAMSACLMTVMCGMGGVSFDKHTVRVNPILPAGVSRYSFTICWRGAVMKTSLDCERLTYELVSGESLRFIHGETAHRIHLHTGFRSVEAIRRVSIPRISFRQTGQFDGAIFQCESLFHSVLEYDYVSWHRVLEMLFDNYRTLQHRCIAPLNPAEYIERVVYQAEKQGIAFSGIHNVLLDRGIDLDLGTADDAEIVETRYGLANAKVSEMMELFTHQMPAVNTEMLALVRALAQSGIALAMVTYSRSLRHAMAYYAELSSYFIASIGGEEAHDRRIKGRPHVDLFLRAAEKIHVDPRRCVVFSMHLDRDYCAESMGKFQMFLDVEDPFVSSRVPLRPYPTLDAAVARRLQRDDRVVCRVLLSSIPKTVDSVGDVIDGRELPDPLQHPSSASLHSSQHPPCA